MTRVVSSKLLPRTWMSTAPPTWDGVVLDVYRAVRTIGEEDATRDPAQGERAFAQTPAQTREAVDQLLVLDLDLRLGDHASDGEVAHHGRRAVGVEEREHVAADGRARRAYEGSEVHLQRREPPREGGAREIAHRRPTTPGGEGLTETTPRDDVALHLRIVEADHVEPADLGKGAGEPGGDAADGDQAPLRELLPGLVHEVDRRRGVVPALEFAQVADLDCRLEVRD
jgi:hypothetical protein